MLVDLKELSIEELESFLATLGQERYRARQIMRWIYRRAATSFAEMTDLSKGLRAELGDRAHISSLAIAAVDADTDGTRKFIFTLADGNQVEGVLIPDEGRLTLCVSTQAGCAMGCRFCLTGEGGFVRDLTCGEILNQISAVASTLPPGVQITNCVLMGMGEPLANYEQVRKAIFIMASVHGFGLSRRRITLSTVGLIPEMKRLSVEGVPCRLAVSLNAANEEVRSFLMPINKRYPLEELLEACRGLPLPPRERITFEYVLINGVNDAEGEARRLAQILRGIRCKINLIPLNESPGNPFRRPPEGRILAFQKVLIAAGYTTIIRQSKGGGISAACGQLRGRLTGALFPHSSARRGCGA